MFLRNKAAASVLQSWPKSSLSSLPNKLGPWTARLSSTSQSCPEVEVRVQDGVRTILIDRPDKFNALTIQMFEKIGKALVEGNRDEATRLVLWTSRGKVFCSGNDLANLALASTQTELGTRMLREFTGSFVACEKPVIALVHGPVVGIAFTVLGLCDAVYASDRATFHGLLTALGTSPEGCASYTFPRIMGYAKANELLLFNRKITAAQACDWGLVSRVFPHATFQEEAWRKVKELAQLPLQSLVWSKDLVRGAGGRELLHKVNQAESERMKERLQSEDSCAAVQKFLARKSKSA